MKRPVTALLLCMLVAACGGGSSQPAQIVLPVASQSPGSHWFVKDPESNPFHLYISETGKLRTSFHMSGSPNATSFGAGSVSVSNGDQVNGTMQALGVDSSTGRAIITDLSCTLTGTVSERSTLATTVSCSDSSQVVYNEFLTFTPQPNYAIGSSLVDIAGNYTLPIRPASNTLNITANGQLFGMLDNGAQCTLNGTVSIIDDRYRFFDVAWTMSNCTDPFGIYEGAEMSGFAMPSADPNDPPGNYYFLLTRSNSSSFYALSVTYERT